MWTSLGHQYVLILKLWEKCGEMMGPKYAFEKITILWVVLLSYFKKLLTNMDKIDLKK